LKVIGMKKGFILESPVENKAGAPVEPKPIIINALGHIEQ